MSFPLQCFNRNETPAVAKSRLSFTEENYVKCIRIKLIWEIVTYEQSTILRSRDALKKSHQPPAFSNGVQSYQDRLTSVVNIFFLLLMLFPIWEYREKIFMELLECQ